MNKPYDVCKEQAVWIERGEALGRFLNRKFERKVLERVWKAPSTGIHRLLYWFGHLPRRRRPVH